MHRATSRLRLPPRDDAVVSLLRDNLIYFVNELNARERLCIPAAMGKGIFKLTHDCKSHGGVHRNYKRIIEYYYISALPSMLIKPD